MISVLDRLGIDYELHGDEAVAKCPMHEAMVGKQDNSPSWNFNVESGLHLCWSCGYKGNAFSLVADVLGMRGKWGEVDWDEVRQWVGSSDAPLRMTVPSYESRALRPQPVDEVKYLALDLVDEEMAAGRGLRPETCERFGLRVRDGAWCFPIRYHDGSFLGWQEKRGKEVRNRPAGVRKGTTVFAVVEAQGHGGVVVVESPTDALLCWERGLPAVATFGAKVTPDQIALMSQWSPVLALDNDDAGRSAQRELSDALHSRGARHKVVLWDTEDKDFGDCPDDIERLVAGAVDPLVMRFGELAR